MKTQCKKIRVSTIYNGPYSGGWGSCGNFNDVLVIDEIGMQIERTRIECQERFDETVKNKVGKFGAYVPIPDLKKIEKQIKIYQKKYPDSKTEWRFIPNKERENLPKSESENIRRFAVIKTENPAFAVIVDRFSTKERAKAEAAIRGTGYRVIELQSGGMFSMYVDNPSDYPSIV